jgi:transposase-like protein
MEQRIRMLSDYESGNWSVSELCRRYGICRDTFYEWCARKANGDQEWFKDRSHAPLHCPQMTDGAIAEKVIAARRRFPYLGPRKLLFVLERERPGDHLACGLDDRRDTQAGGFGDCDQAPAPAD